MRMLSHDDINAQVMRGLDKNSRRIGELVGRMPRVLQPIGREYSGMQGTGFYRGLQRDRYTYRMYCLTKD